MPRRFDRDLKDVQRTELAAMSREELEAWGWRQHELARELANRLGADSRTSSRPPSSDDPYRGDDGKPPAAPPGKTGMADEKKTARPAGKRPGSKGFWRSQRIVTSAEVPHAPKVCAVCGSILGPDLERRCVEAHDSLELARGLMSLQVTATKHVYFAVLCPCGHDNVARPGVGPRSEIEGRRRNLQLSERCLVGPTPTFSSRRSGGHKSARKLNAMQGDVNGYLHHDDTEVAAAPALL